MAWLDHYAFWLTAVSLLCLGLERCFPWRRAQPALRPQLAQDLFFLVWNGHFLALLLALATTPLAARVNGAFEAAGLPRPDSLNVLAESSFSTQFVVFLVLKDLLEWGVHNLLHRVPALWELHKLHHSIETLDWIGNFRFHWGEVVVYRTLTYLPLVLLGVEGRVVLAVAVVGTLIGHLNHSNLPISWGPLRYVLNSPKMHVWHHDAILRGGHGQNFGVVFSLWDFLFGTAHWPEGQPAQLGFEGIERFPRGLVGRMLYPLGARR